MALDPVLGDPPVPEQALVCGLTHRPAESNGVQNPDGHHAGWDGHHEEHQRQPVELLRGEEEVPGDRASHGREAEPQLRDTGRPQPRAGATDTAAAGCTGHGRLARGRERVQGWGLHLVTPEGRHSWGLRQHVGTEDRNYPCRHGSGAEGGGQPGWTLQDSEAPRTDPPRRRAGADSGREMATVPGGGGRHPDWVLAEAAVPGGGRGAPGPRHMGVCPPGQDRPRSTLWGRLRAHSVPVEDTPVHQHLLQERVARRPGLAQKRRCHRPKPPDSTSERAQQGGSSPRPHTLPPRRRPQDPAFLTRTEL